MIRSEVIYEKKFPKIDIPSVEVIKKMNKSETDNAERITFEQIIEKIYKDVVYVFMPERKEKAKVFVEKAIEVSELYEMDICVEQHFSHISVSYYFDCGGAMKYLIDVISLADEISFFRPKDGYELIMSLDFYTHAEFRNGRQCEP